MCHQQIEFRTDVPRNTVVVEQALGSWWVVPHVGWDEQFGTRRDAIRRANEIARESPVHCVILIRGFAEHRLELS